MSLSKAFARIFWWFAAALLAVAIVFGVIQLSRISGARPVSGEIIRYRVVQNAIPFTEEDSGIQNYPVIRYEAMDGSSNEFISPRPVDTEEYSVGDSIGLLLTTGDRVIVDSFWGIWGRSIVFAGTALIFFIFGLAALKGFDTKEY
ncbi:hypothetical protein [Salinispira pacifica]|uniref:DUF3592 domain-containing protein n=1 Tax=Salinispira pacifica TaxID=1307761 RepID=V5WEL5_9SPIO|nr:hypothetical protein [Salinispira pacifica]AHC13601.1 hypothetical protein L21SP2_0157 [Salinispira pacifica]